MRWVWIICMLFVIIGAILILLFFVSSESLPQTECRRAADVTVITFAEGAAYQSCCSKLQAWFAKRRITQFQAFSSASIDDQFKQKNARIFDLKRGSGYWLWKPYIIHQTLSRLPENAILLYCDACSRPDELIDDLVKRAETSGVAGYATKYIEDHFTKGDVFQALDAMELRDSSEKQRAATVIAFQNTSAVRTFVEMWLKYCQDGELITDAPSRAPNHPAFRAHRHDQSIFSVLSHKLAVGDFISSRYLAHHVFDRSNIVSRITKFFAG